MGSQEEIVNELILFTIVGLTLVFSIIVLVFVFYQRKGNLLIEQEKEKQQYEREIAKSQIEIREETLRNISWELHDNIGQLMTLAKIQAQNAKDNPRKLDEATQIIGDALDELRALSKSINPESFGNLGFVKSLQREVDRFNRLNFIHSELIVQGEPFHISQKVETILFRILQEFFSNTIRHSRATHLIVLLNYEKSNFKICVKDNGMGFDFDEEQNMTGIGLKSMKKRAELIGAEFLISSEKNIGTMLFLDYAKK